MRANEFITEQKAIHLSGLSRFFKKGDPLVDHIPERGTHTFALHPDKWQSTFYSLTNKDLEKLKYYKPKEIDIVPGTLVGDMYYANKFYRASDDSEKQKFLELYKDSLKPVDSVDIKSYRMPELLIPKTINEKWSQKYKRSINCKNPKGFSQRAHCQGRKKKANEEYTKDGKYVIRAMTYEDQVIEVRADKLAKFINKSLKDAGYKKLGSGIDASVWMKDQGTVVKIIMPDWDAEASINKMQAFYNFSKNHPELENLPIFKKADGREFFKFSLGGIPFMQFSMEQLHPLKKGSLQEYVVWYFSGEIDKNWQTAYNNLVKSDKKFGTEFKNLDPKEIEKYRRFFETFRLLYRLGKKNKWGWDAHTENVMRRSDGTLGITDPWA
jgi:hypothetical protein